MQGSFLKFYVEENQRHQDALLWEWLLEKACELKIRGGSAFRAISGFGRHHMLHESRFFELVGNVVEVEFIVSEEEERRLIEIIQSEISAFSVPAFLLRLASSIRIAMICDDPLVPGQSIRKFVSVFFRHALYRA